MQLKNALVNWFLHEPAAHLLSCLHPDTKAQAVFCFTLNIYHAINKSKQEQSKDDVIESDFWCQQIAD